MKVYGCQYNEWDAARLEFALQRLGLASSNEKNAKIIFVFNCSVRKTAVDRALGKIKNWQEKKVVVTACVLPADKPRFLAKNVTLWDGKDLGILSKIIGLAKFNKELNNIFNLENHTSSYIPIMKGCDNFCSYCAVPYTRGREVSRPFEEIIADAEKLIANGSKVIILLGQNVNSYQSPQTVIPARSTGSGLTPAGILNDKIPGQARDDNNIGFSKLLTELDNLPGNFVIKFTSNHPKDMSDEIIEAVANLPKVAKEIHLPLQSGSNKVLRSMNRPYTKEEYLALIKKIKSTIPKIKISTDTIVGFPTETEEDFQETVLLLKQVDFFQIYNNKYSPREGTAAWKLGDPIPWSEKQRRWRILNEITNK